MNRKIVAAWAVPVAFCLAGIASWPSLVLPLLFGIACGLALVWSVSTLMEHYS